MLPDQSNAPELVLRLFDFSPWRNANSKPSALRAWHAHDVLSQVSFPPGATQTKNRTQPR